MGYAFALITPEGTTVPITSVPSDTGLFGGSPRRPKTNTRSVPPQAQPGSPTSVSADVGKMSAVTLVGEARELGFALGPSPDGPDTVLVVPPTPTTANKPAVLAMAQRLRDPVIADLVVDIVLAGGQSSTLRSPPPKPPRRIGFFPDGRPMGAVELPAVEPPPPIHTPTLCSDLSSLRTVAEVDVFIRRVELGLQVADKSIGYLPEVAQNEPHEITERRDRLLYQTRVLTDHLFHLQERRSELFMAHVDQVAAKNAQAEAAAKVDAWLHGRAPRPH